MPGPKTRVIDLKGRRVVPGFYDSHVHLLGSGLRLGEVALKDAKDEAEFGKRLREFDRKLPRDRWLLGGEWDHDRTFGGTTAHRRADRQVRRRPAGVPAPLRRSHGASSTASSCGRPDITAKTADPPGGVIYRKPGTKEPTGLLRDNAMGLVDGLVPAPSETEIIEAVRAALAEARQDGVTSVQDMDGSGDATRRMLFRVYQQLARDGKLTLRIDLRWPLGEWQALAKMGVEAGFGDDWVKVGGLKGFVDGASGSSTAKMFEPFVNEPGSTGVYVTPLDKMRRDVIAADRAGLSVAVHAIGDRANAELLDIFAEAAKAQRPARPALPHRARPAPAAAGLRRASRSWASSRRCSRTTPSTTAAGPRAASGRSAARRPTPSARCSTPGRSWRSARTGRWRR